MVAKEVAGCWKISMSIFSFIFLISGLVFLALGIHLLVKEGAFATFIPSLPFLNAANLFIATGVIIFLVAFVGYCGACIESKICIITFVVLLFGIFILEIAAGVLAFVYRNEIETYVTEDLTGQSLRKYDAEGEDGITKAWDLLQTQLQCCGVNSKSDWWIYTDTFKPEHSPDSCCYEYYDGCGQDPSQRKWEVGCKDPLIHELEKNVNILFIIGAVIILFEILGMCLACTLCCGMCK